MPSSIGYNFTNISTATTTAVKSGAGKLLRVIVNTAVAGGVITIYNNTAASVRAIQGLAESVQRLAVQQH